ncbi:transmembrane protein, putative (macronuclear) [Tetrahymena thermophila SB210]|uniref:Transmembrane protein, putative n=1 Tax=Tetrahymena thermophila (strain SB210) TaxID=312017 RepID=I7M115_TETTS|nr:transmembrane protein, putative [Tetrahymena thermophila SB210]EAR93837.1 transmembrane protein, putative [Tetrahymena thermophila SB210]|eukprot:XP_001014082.1 transmembrane protein, putative [Tetrahymena thermophila SB210]
MKSILLYTLFALIYSQVKAQIIFFEQDSQCRQYVSFNFGSSDQIIKFQMELYSTISFVFSTSCPGNQCVSNQKLDCQSSNGCKVSSQTENIINAANQTIFYANQATSSIFCQGCKEMSIKQLNFDFVYSAAAYQYYDYAMLGLFPSNSFSNFYNQVQSDTYRSEQNLWFALASCYNKNRDLNTDSQMGFLSFNETITNRQTQRIFPLLKSDTTQKYFQARVIFYDQIFVGSYQLQNNYQFIEVYQQIFDNIVTRVSQKYRIQYATAQQDIMVLTCNPCLDLDDMVILNTVDQYQYKPIQINRKYLTTSYNSSHSIFNIIASKEQVLNMGVPFFYDNVVLIAGSVINVYDQKYPDANTIISSSSQIISYQIIYLGLLLLALMIFG